MSEALRLEGEMLVVLRGLMCLKGLYKCAEVLLVDDPLCGG